MIIHKNTKLTPLQRKKVYDDYHKHKIRKCALIKKYQVSRPTIDKILNRGRKKDFSIHSSENKRFVCLEYGLKRLSKIEKKIEEKLKKKAKIYNKSYPGEMIHVDTKRLPLLKGESPKDNREYLFVGIDDYSRELYAIIAQDKTQYSSEKFLNQMIEECPYTIEQIYSDNGLEYKGNSEKHAFMLKCKSNNIEQRFTKVKHPWTNGKAERVIRTLMEMWHDKTQFKNRNHRKKELIRFINYYNTVKPHKGIDNNTPMEQLINYFYPTKL
jgi:transposase InsO family protein